jgi:predicted permease
MEQLIRDVRVALRQMARQPAFSFAVILLFGLGVGATTAVFTLVEELLLSPPALIGDPQNIVRLNPKVAGTIGVSTYADYEHLRDNNTVFSAVFAFDPPPTSTQLRVGNAVGDADARFVTGNFFSALGTAPLAGRMLQPADDAEHAPNVAVLSDRFVERYFPNRVAAIGSSVRINGQLFTVVGVIANEFIGPTHDAPPVDVWLPVWKRPLVTGRPREDMIRVPGTIHAFLTTLARLRPGVSLAQAQAGTDAVLRPLAQTHENDEGVAVTLSPVFGLGPARHATVVTLTKLIGGISLIVLLIVCANLGNLMLSRAVARRGELVIRLALGARRVRLIQQTAIETVLLGVAGAALGLLLSFWGARGLGTFLPFRLAQPLAPDASAIAFASAIASFVAIVCTIAPALVAARSTTIQTVSTRTTSSTSIARNILVTTQVALCFILVCGATLFVRTLQQVQSVELGFAPRGLLFGTIDLRPYGYTEAATGLFLDRLMERMRAYPGVLDASMGSVPPLAGGRRSGSIEIEGRPVDPERGLVSYNDVVAADYFRTLQIRLLQGREFTSGDVAGTPPVVIVNQSFASRYWPEQNPIGRRMRRGPNAPWMEVVGVVGDVRAFNIVEAPEPMFFRPYAQAYTPRMSIYARTGGATATLSAPFRAAVAELDPNVVPRSVRTFDEVYDDAVRGYTANARLVSVLGTVALILAAIGLYALTAYLVTQRTREFGLRMAIGAQRADVLRQVLSGALQLAAAGLVIGALGAVSLVPLVESFLFELSPLDPLAFAAAAGLLAAATTVAAFLPARRATRVDPVVALRTD